MNEYNITIELKSNLHVGSGFGFAKIIDHTSIKDSEGLAFIPGSTIKGKLRSLCRKIALTLEEENFKSSDIQKNICDGGRVSGKAICKVELEKACILCRLFGSVYQEGKLIFTDATLTDVNAKKILILSKFNRFDIKEQNETKPGVKVSRGRRTSDPKHLFMSENVSHYLTFKGKIYTKQPLNSDEKALLKYGLKLLSHIGGQKSRGLGRLKSIKCPELD